jgi:hypothetical protein
MRKAEQQHLSAAATCGRSPPCDAQGVPAHAGRDRAFRRAFGLSPLRDSAGIPPDFPQDASTYKVLAAVPRQHGPESGMGL